ncbi:unnamed protein product [Cladocopium goreaui]|uniref:Exosome complex component RRP41 n=1 Tax=Cladocopium goreaui TaxID=2562237 RepID=A0A9P1BSB6_9DINO|nr:unnamed protein product [Cladocopium goreaui]|mmetsp:Transcript_38083/g.81934  ORF Transcript_38083/g.81934 Transcript_38083/m.81934 type:complete len:250 (+) Transcript_38083:34-783(+)
MAMEAITPEGFRADGRRVNEPRGIQCCVGGHGREADGYAVFELGSTKAVAYVYGPMEAKQRSQSLHDRATLSCTLSTATFATVARNFGRKGDRQSQERSMWLQQTFESAILLEQYPRSQIRLFVQILQAEGSPVAAAINAATLALADAGIPMRDLVVACTAGMLGRKPAMDLSREEEQAGGAEILLASLTGAKRVSLLEVESKVPEGSAFTQLYEMALQGCHAIAEQMRTCLLEHASEGFSLRKSRRKA